MAPTIPPYPRDGRCVRVGALLLLLVSCATPSSEGRDEPDLPRVVTGGSVVLRLGITSPELAARCLSATAIGREVLRAEFGTVRFDAEDPLLLNLYRDRAALALWAPDAGAPAWRPPSAFEDGEGHLALLPRTEDWYLELTGGAGSATLHALWYEIARQGILRYARSRMVSWPAWFTEGLAECLALECWRRDAGYPGREPLWWTDLTATASRAAAAEALPPLWRLVHMEAYEAQDEDAFRAEAAYFCWFLRQDPVTWRRFADRIDDLKAPGRTGMGFDSVGRFEDALIESYGDLVLLHTRMEEGLLATAGEWVPFLGFPERTADGFLLAAAPDEDAGICRRVLPGPAFDFEFECRRLDPAPGALLVFHAMDSPRPAGFIRLSIADGGALTVDRWTGGAHDPGESATYLFDRSLFPFDAWTRVTVRVTGRHLEVVVGDLLLLSEEVPVSSGSGADCIGIGSGAGVYEIRNIAHRSRPAPE
jgi:hypothetical protein